MGKKILLAPALQKGMGTGHLARNLSLKHQLKENCFILYEGSSPEFDIRQHPLAASGPLTVTRPGTRAPWDLILLDRKATPLKDYLRLNRYGPVAGLDEGGPARDYLPYLIDILPGLKRQSPANISALTLLDLPLQKKQALIFPFLKILISFGGEDSANLSSTIVNALLSGSLFKTAGQKPALTLVQGPYFKQKIWPAGITVLYAPQRLQDLLCRYDLVITSFGLTCFEALAAGVPVILFNPTAYHRSLSCEAGLPEIGVIQLHQGRFKKLINDRAVFEKQHTRYTRLFSSRTQLQKPASLSEFISLLACPDPQTGKFTGNPDLVFKNRCPVCEKPLNPVIVRFRHKTYFRCRQCGILYLHYFPLTGTFKEENREKQGKQEKPNRQEAQPRRYTAAYFLDEYRQQYGKTYLEDFPNLKKLARQRLAIIVRLMGLKRNRHKADFLDIGCALGPFLSAGRARGLHPWGMDVCAEAVAYVKQKLGIPCLAADFEQGSRPVLEALLLNQWGKKQFTFITMWYVIEHFRDLKGVLQKINALLPRGGLFAFSTPNGAGISAKGSLRSFLDKSPRDHYTIWTPALTENILKSFGFKIKFFRSTGHHPERFSFLGKKPFRNLKPGSRCWLYLAYLSRLLKWGDTFEVYAVKIKNL